MQARGTRGVPKDDLFAGMHFNAILTLGTRVRIEVLKAIAKELQSPDTHAYAPDFGPRPILVVLPTNKPSYSVLYGEAIERYGHLLTREKLTHAYKRAGTAFKGQMRQNFWVLHDPKPRTSIKRTADGEPVAN